MTQLTGYDYFLQNALKYGWVVPQGAIIMWGGAIADIPSGWVFCNGSNSTPDLRDKFVIGAKQDDAGVAKTNIEGSLKQTGGAIQHDHSFTGDGHAHALLMDTNPTAVGGENEVSTGTVVEPAAGTTDLNPNPLVPPYYALAYIMKT